MTTARAGRARAVAPSFTPPDTVTLLTVYLVVLYAIPSSRSIAALGSAGSVSISFGAGALVLWLFFSIIHSPVTVESRPVDPAATPAARRHRTFDFDIEPVAIAQLVLVCAVLASYVAAMTRAIPPGEMNTADTGLIRIAAWSGILLLAGDGIVSVDRFTVMARRVAAAGAAVASLGVAQFVTGLSLIDAIVIPGLTTGDSSAGVQVRGGLLRSAGTASHPLEYGMMLAMILPVAVVLALRDRPRSALRRWFPVAAIAAGMTLAGSRSAIIGLAIGLIVLVPALARRERWVLVGSIVVFTGLVYAAAPRVVSNLRYLFISAGEDSSSQSRTEGIGMVTEFVTRNPVFGRGFGTFLPVYKILDNQYYALAIELGILGLLAFLAVSATAIVCSVVAARRVPEATEPLTRALGFALAASLAAGTVLLALFDGLSFAQAAGTLFLFLGLAGAYWRLVRARAA